jgi:hypothetical protein
MPLAFMPWAYPILKDEKGLVTRIGQVPGAHLCKPCPDMHGI